MSGVVVRFTHKCGHTVEYGYAAGNYAEADRKAKEGEDCSRCENDRRVAALNEKEKQK